MNKVKGVRLAAAADIREEARSALTRDCGLPTFASVEELCESGVAAAACLPNWTRALAPDSSCARLVDIAAHIAGSRAMRVRAMTGRWDGAVPTEGNCAVLIQFESGAVANLSLNGYGYFGTSELTWDIGIFLERKVAGKPAAKCVPLSEAEKYAEGANARLATRCPLSG